MAMINVSQPEFYYPYILTFCAILIGIECVIWLAKRKDENDYHDLSEDELLLVKNEEFIRKGETLKFKYMAAFLTAKAGMWAKAPYTFMLFSTYHGFTIGEIGFLYIIDAATALIAGPFLGVLADTFGRKFVSTIYGYNNIFVLILRMTGNKPTAYFAQFFTGAFGGILSTSYESWLNYEINKLYGENENYIHHYRKKIFSTIMLYDSIISITVTILGTVLYVHYISDL